MDEEFKLKLKIKEFQQAVGVDKYDVVVERLIRKAKLKSITIAYWPNGDVSSACADDNGGYMVRIKGKILSDNRREILYDIMHEMGHCLDEIKLLKEDEDNKVLKRGREERAWQLADQEFKSHPELDADAADYAAYKASCLLTYPTGNPSAP